MGPSCASINSTTPSTMDKARSTSPITLGKPVPYTYFDGSKSNPEWADHMKSKVYELGKQHD
jgi:hypothetical protein